LRQRLQRRLINAGERTVTRKSDLVRPE
jgi:hypothetical protein